MTKNMWQVSKRGLTIKLRVTPKSSRDAITGIYTNAYSDMSLKVSTTAQPEKGKSNKAVIAILSKDLGKAKSLFKAIDGETRRNKTILIDGDVNHIISWLEPAFKESENG